MSAGYLQPLTPAYFTEMHDLNPNSDPIPYFALGTVNLDQSRLSLSTYGFS